MDILPALIPGHLESLRSVVNARRPELVDLRNTAIFFRNVAWASALISPFFASASLHSDNKSTKVVATLALVGFGLLAARSVKECFENVKELQCLKHKDGRKTEKEVPREIRKSRKKLATKPPAEQLQTIDE